MWFGAAALLALLPLAAYAATFRSGDTVDIRANETIRDDFYAGGGSVTSSGSVTGDLYAGGGTILITGSVAQDAVVGGGTITVTGDVGDDLRAGGGTIVVQGAVGGDVVVGGGQIHLSGSRIGGDVLAGGGVVRIDAAVGNDVKVGGGSVFINGPVAGNVEADADTLTLGSAAVITGNLSYTSPKEVVIEEGARVGGKTTYTPRADRGDAGAALAIAFFSVAAIVKILMMLAAAFFFGLVFHRYSTHLVQTAYARPLMEIGRGFILLIVMPVASVFLMVTIVGLPLGFLGLIGYIGALIFSWLVAPLLIGSLIYQWITKEGYQVNWKTILLGVFAFCIAGVVPILGSLVQFGFIVLALGTTLHLKWNIAKEWR